MHIGSHWISYMGPGSPISGSRFPLPLVPWSPHVPHPCLHTVPTCWLGQNLHPGCSTMKKPKTYPLHWHAHAETALADGATQNMALLEHVGLAGYPRHQTMHPTAHTLNPTGYPPFPGSCRWSHTEHVAPSGAYVHSNKPHGLHAGVRPK